MPVDAAGKSEVKSMTKKQKVQAAKRISKDSMIKDETLKHPLQIVTLNGDCRWQVKNDLLGRINFN
jgi:hypothetical protein